MALVMVSAMGVIMLVSMWGMFKNKRLNVFLLGAFAVGFLAVLTLGRSETFVGDDQFLRSMIPHHSRAILVCQESTLTDPEIIALCEQIVSLQTEEIQQMKETCSATDRGSRDSPVARSASVVRDPQPG